MAAWRVRGHDAVADGGDGRWWLLLAAGIAPLLAATTAAANDAVPPHWRSVDGGRLGVAVGSGCCSLSFSLSLAYAISLLETLRLIGSCFPPLVRSLSLALSCCQLQIESKNNK